MGDGGPASVGQTCPTAQTVPVGTTATARRSPGEVEHTVVQRFPFQCCTRMWEGSPALVLVPLPTAQTSRPDTAATAESEPGVVAGTKPHRTPFQCSMTVCPYPLLVLPTTQMS